MIELLAAAQSVLTRSYTYHLAVESWRGEQLLADDIPVDAAGEETDRTLRVPERVTLSVPRIDRGTAWAPVDEDHPLAAAGQRIRVQLGIGTTGGVEWFTRGWYLVQDARLDGDTVSVTAVGLLALIDEARLVSPYQPSGTLASTVRGLVEPALTVDIDAGLTDRAVPSAAAYDEDRLGALLELLDGWPADAYITPDGYLSVTPATQSTTPVLAVTDGTGGTVIRAAGDSTREGAYNVVIARGTAADGGQVQGVAYVTAGPTAYGGPFNPLPVPYPYTSPLITTVAQAQAAAAAIAGRLQRAAGREYRIEMVPHPGLQAGDVIALTTADVTALPCAIEHLSLPYTAGGGAQSLRVRSLS